MFRRNDPPLCHAGALNLACSGEMTHLDLGANVISVIDHLPSTQEEVNAFYRICLSVCLSVSKNVCVHLDEMLHVYRCRDMDELINF